MRPSHREYPCCVTLQHSLPSLGLGCLTLHEAGLQEASGPCPSGTSVSPVRKTVSSAPVGLQEPLQSPPRVSPCSLIVWVCWSLQF